MSTATAQFKRLRAAGFGGRPLMDALGQLDALYLTRSHGGVIDCLLVRSETEALATRIRDERNPRNAVLWSYAGDLVSAVSELLDLPAPDQRGAPNLAHPGQSELWTPQWPS